MTNMFNPLYLLPDVQDMCRKLADKDETITRLQERCNTAVDSMQKDYSNEKVVLIQDKHRLEDNPAKAK